MFVKIESKKIKSSELDPLYVYSKFRADNTYILESVEGQEKVARYSIIGLNPLFYIRVKDGRVVKKSSIRLPKRIPAKTKDPLNTLRDISRCFKLAKDTKSRFAGGMVGYCSYDLVKYYYDIRAQTKDDLKHPDCEYVIAGNNIIFDHIKREIHITANTFSGVDSPVEKLDEIHDRILDLSINKPAFEKRAKKRRLSYESNMTATEYASAVKQAKKYITAGDIFQVVPSQRLAIEYDDDPLRAYHFLKKINPSPYMYFLDFKSRQIAGSSPEMLARVEDGRVWTHPIAGTRPRGKTVKADDKLARQMLADKKERAEHLMLVDLGRNDVGRVSKYGTVKVSRFMQVEKYSHVQHIVSEVTGQMRADKDEFDALKSIFPAGTVSGAPKVRAMEIIEELEPTKRGIYAGSIGYFSFNNNMDTAIAIRTLVFEGKKAHAQSGGGVVADSIPKAEYIEARNKAKALLTALEY